MAQPWTFYFHSETLRKDEENPAEVTNKSKSKQNLKACFFDYVPFRFSTLGTKAVK